jgi:hypothetical protein
VEYVLVRLYDGGVWFRVDELELEPNAPSTGTVS